MMTLHIVLVCFILILIGIVVWLAFAYGYEKGINDLTKKIDNGIQKINEQKRWETFCERLYDDSDEEETVE